MKDLFEDYENLPEDVNKLINQFGIDKEISGVNGYMLCSNLDEDLQLIGYCCDYGLDAEPFDLQKLEDIKS